MLSTLKPVVGSLPSSSAPHGSRVNAPPATMLRVNPKISTSLALQERGKEERLHAQETTRAAVSRRDVMGIAAAGLGISLAKPAEAVEVANSGNPISQFLDLLKDLVGTPKPKPEGDEPKTVGDEKAPVDNKAEPSNPKTEGDQQQPTASSEAKLSEPKTEGEVKAETEAVGEN
nr:histone H1-I-like [Ipomoea batatas]